jgi:clamp loader A subunit
VPELKEWLGSINSTKENLMDSSDDSVEKSYIPYIINRCLYPFTDTILFVNELNTRPHLEKRMQYEYLLHTLRQRKRFSPWLKADAVENLDAVMEYYNYTPSRAKAALELLTPEQIKYIKARLNKGGFR